LITAVDTNILIDILEPDPEHGPSSRDALKRCMREGALVCCEVVWAEVSTAYGSDIEKITHALDRMEIEFSPMSREAALEAAKCWHAYRRKERKRERIVADFLIGGHASIQCNRLLTRDRGFYRKYFKSLNLVSISKT
jgi:predicted nucleic acid-binding protein